MDKIILVSGAVTDSACTMTLELAIRPRHMIA